MSQTTVEQEFRHHYGKLVASLIDRFGGHQIDAIEDALQHALEQALRHWPPQPNNPTGWLYRVAANQLMAEGRSQQRRQSLLDKHIHHQTEPVSDPTPQPDAMSRALLNTLFVACQEAVPVPSQLAFTLKYLCGFQVSEVAALLLTSPGNVYKRLTRAKKQLADQPLNELIVPPHRQIQRLPCVHTVVYLMFTEGHLSAYGDQALKLELCSKAAELTQLLTRDPLTQTPATYALLALMHLNLARFPARQSPGNSLLLLEQQNRACWDKTHISQGIYWLHQSATGSQLCRYHLEASIAAEHCLAASYEQTAWDRICRNYALLEQLCPSPMVYLAHAVALAELQGPNYAQDYLNGKRLPPHLAPPYQWNAVKADIALRLNQSNGQSLANLAIQKAPNLAVKNALLQRFKRYPLFSHHEQSPG